MTAMRKEVRVTANDDAITIRYRDLRWYGSDGPWRQITFPARVFEKALAEAKIAVPWSMVSR